MLNEDKSMEGQQGSEAIIQPDSGINNNSNFEGRHGGNDYEKEARSPENAHIPENFTEPAPGVDGQRDVRDFDKESRLQDGANNASSDDQSSRTVVPPPDAPAAPISPTMEAPKDPEATRTTLQTFIIMLCLCASVFLAALDTTIITTALPTISEYFQSSSGYTWIGSAYLLANAASTPIWGKISDIWGRKPILLCAAGVFLLGSGLAGGSNSITMLIAARAVQGIGGGGLIVLSNIAISDLFSMRSRGKYFGMIGGVWAFAGGVGPILGGVFTERASWRWCFYVNLPITGAAIIGIFMFLHLENPRTPVLEGMAAIDWTGSLLIVGGTLMLLLGLEYGGVSYPWNSAIVLCLITFGVFTGFLFFLNEWKIAKYPVMPIRLFKDRSRLACLAVCASHGATFIAGSYYLPLYFQAVLGASPLLSGVYLLPFALSLAFTSAITGVIIKKTGKYLILIRAGLVVMTLGFGLFIDLDADANWAKIIIFQIIAGIGVGPNFQSPLIALQSTVDPRDIATATATFGFTRNLSTAVSVVIGGVVFQNQMVKKFPTLLAGLGSQIANELGGGNAGANVAVVQSLPPAQQTIAKQAFFESLRTMWIMYVAFSAAGVVASLFISSNKLNKQHTVVKVGLGAEKAKRLELQEQKRQSKEMLRMQPNGEHAATSEKVAGEAV